ncbi:MAG: phosphonopyruvate decarboxylase [Acidobacteria bacterium]|nr:MAG: phosphonopyruvate decarboxylase [Acidobacteriota bacterium]
MIAPELFAQALLRRGFGMFSGVPCSYLTPLINTVIESDDIRYVGAANEGDAVAIACGAELGGTRGVVMFQNSGFGNAINPLTSLAATLRIPLLLIVTWRGHPDQPKDEPQHEMMGAITPRLLDLIDVPWEICPTKEEDIPAMLDRAVTHMDGQRTPYGILLEKGTIKSHALASSSDFEQHACPQSNGTSDQMVAEHGAGRLDQDDVLEAIQSSARETDVVLATTGYTGRALYALDDRPNQLYMVGSMGCASSLGLGLSMVQPRRRVIVIDGDGSLLMRMGALATIAHERPDNLIHVVLDNAVHDSTGGQATVSPSLDFVGLSRSCGYPRSKRITNLDELQGEIKDDRSGLRFLHVRTKPRENRKLPRPTVTPDLVARRLRRWVQGAGA